EASISPTALARASPFSATRSSSATGELRWLNPTARTLIRILLCRHCFPQCFPIIGYGRPTLRTTSRGHRTLALRRRPYGSDDPNFCISGPRSPEYVISIPVPLVRCRGRRRRPDVARGRPVSEVRWTSRPYAHRPPRAH